MYPTAGLPTSAPPAYPSTESSQHCDEWTDWAIAQKIAPVGNQIDLKVDANVTSPVTVKDIQVRRFSKRIMDSRDQIKCTYGAGGEMGANVNVDLDDSERRHPMDIDADGEPDTTLPGGVFVVDSAESNWITLYYSGQPGAIYGVAITVVYAENGSEQRATFGTDAAPLYLATYADQVGAARYVDWDFSASRWTDAPQSGVFE
jgi:hypothetical protein